MIEIAAKCHWERNRNTDDGNETLAARAFDIRHAVLIPAAWINTIVIVAFYF